MGQNTFVAIKLACCWPIRILTTLFSCPSVLRPQTFQSCGPDTHRQLESRPASTSAYNHVLLALSIQPRLVKRDPFLKAEDHAGSEGIMMIIIRRALVKCCCHKDISRAQATTSTDNHKLLALSLACMF
ncbi:hypothetical protein BaRGS_00004943 [Batillaria attramentaria]|uniref:Uncharacterized protein n=1 Tax=Batillaria attramentaria TaxID=370345 RepID=A0ABD0LXC4_9CAEN